MCNRRIFTLSFIIGLTVVVLLTMPGALPSVYAQEALPTADHGTCIKCHENLYFLHDTGKWFCIRESPMRCVDCHGGDPSSLKQEVAHASREAHSIVNEDVSTCQECHPAECAERVRKFDQVAGISNVLVAVPYQPRPVAKSELSQQAQPGEPAQYPVWLAALEVITPSLISGLALILYLIQHRRHNKIKNRSHK
jgi:hypothetical protein